VRWRRRWHAKSFPVTAEVFVLDPPSPNAGPRRDGLTPSLVVLHHTAMATAGDALDRLTDPAAEVSAHYLIHRNGMVMQLVPEDLRAWHAGAGSWGGRGDVNSRSIGIEIDNDGRAPFAAAAIVALEALLAEVMERWSIPPQGVIGHSDMAPGRKGDPGPRFDWRGLALAGLSVWPVAPEPREPDAGDFRAQAIRFGYPADIDDALRMRAFRLRFRPAATGPLDATDMGLIHDLAWRYPVDRDSAGA
jgi:N-acetylmuramoyl-L-alanine amidase